MKPTCKFQQTYLVGETTSKQNLLSLSSHGLTEHSRRSSTTTVKESCQPQRGNVRRTPRKQREHANLASKQTVGRREQVTKQTSFYGSCIHTKTPVCKTCYLKLLLVDQLAVLNGKPSSAKKILVKKKR